MHAVTRGLARGAGGVGDRMAAALFAGVLLAAGTSGGGVQGAVVINEIHYHPPSPDGRVHEFVELLNTGPTDVDLSGWAFVEGIEFVFPEGARIAPGGFAVVTRDPAQLSLRFGVSGGAVFGPYEDSLDNSGEEILLVDAGGAYADAVRFGTIAPWPESADGMGDSLQRRCGDGPSSSWANWSAAEPTPLAPNKDVQCPAREEPVPAVVITEIHYHPAKDADDRYEFVEVHNPGSAPVDLSGWRFTDGLEFVFPPGTFLEPGGYLAVARNRQELEVLFPSAHIIGDFRGQLANSGERIALADASGRVVDSVRYLDSGDWPYAADGLGRSLEKVVPTAPSDDPASWASSVLRPAEEFVRVEATGPLGPLLTQRLLLGNLGPGEFIVDDVVLEDLANPGVNLARNGDFEAGLSGWSALGSSAGSRVEDGIGVGGSRGLRLITTGRCDGACPSAESVVFAFPSEGLNLDGRYRLAVSYRYVSGSPQFFARVLRGVEVSAAAALATPGARNSRESDFLPPFISHVRRFPQEPTSRDSVWITARVRPGDSPLPLRVDLTYRIDEGPEVTVPMVDDGAHRDGAARDGVYGAEIPPAPHDSRVLFRIEAAGARGMAGFPHTLDPGVFAPHEHWGYYVNDNQVDSALPVYHILLPGVDPTDPEAINAALSCSILRPGHFAYRGDLYPYVGLRFRGNTMCVVKKRNLKVRFNCGRFFRGLRKINLQSMWTDKALVREHLAWDFIRQLGVPYCETEYVRVHLNGAYHGLFLYLEHPDRRFLKRNGLNESGCLYKAKQPPRANPGGPPPMGVSLPSDLSRLPDYWEEETCEDGDFSDLGEFLTALHADGRSPGGPTAEFMEGRVFQEMLIGYQLAQSVLNNIDSFAKNHFLYGDPSVSPPRWGMITWDMDLVFGKFFDPNAVGLDRPVGTLNDCLLSPGNDLNPWFATSVLGNPRLNFFVDFFFRAGSGYYQRAYLVRLWDLLQEKYRNEVYDPVLDELEAFLADEVAADFARWGRYPSNPGCEVPPDMHSNIEMLKEQLRLHRNFLMSYIRTWHREVIDHPRLKITEILYAPPGGDEDLEFIELWNTSGRRIDISGWRFTEGIRYEFPEGSVIEPDEVFLLVKRPGRFFERFPDVVRSRKIFGGYDGLLSNEGERLRLVDAGPGYPATIDLLDYGVESPWPEADGGRSIELTRAAPDRDNDWPSAWTASIAPGGTPGAIATGKGPVFLRGDADGDMALSLSDAVRVLAFLFMGGGAPACIDAADADDDGAVELNDAVYVLRFLFMGGPPPPPPYPLPGSDPTPDDLICR